MSMVLNGWLRNWDFVSSAMEVTGAWTAGTYTYNQCLRKGHWSITENEFEPGMASSNSYSHPRKNAEVLN